MPQTWQPASKERQFDASGYFSTRTIGALCSPTGGAITVLRISGPEALKIAGCLCGRALEAHEHRRASRVWLRDPSGRKIDDAVMLLYFSPHSFTGEDVVEFFLHGSPMVAQRVLEAVFEAGARLALPGEFSFRAVKNGKMQLSQAEAVNELIAAENDFSLELALEKLSGTQHEMTARIRDDLLQLCTLSEAGIDFSDQDLEEVSLPRLKDRMGTVMELLRRLHGSFDRGRRFRDGVPVSILGLPNAGKSSFFNALLGEDRSIVSEIAGTTRDVVRERLNLKAPSGQITLKLSDTAGLRQSEDEIEGIGIERSIKAAKESDIVVVVIDGVEPRLDQIASHLESLAGRDVDLVFIATKSDCVPEAVRVDLSAEIRGLFSEEVLWCSSVSLEGIRAVADAMAVQAEVRLARKPGEVILTQASHVKAVEECLGTLARARASSDLVLFATDIRHAMNDLGPLIGGTLPDDVLGKIFSDFCIGK
jgi:tRNA modification GTPase